MLSCVRAHVLGTSSAPERMALRVLNSLPGEQRAPASLDARELTRSILAGNATAAALLWDRYSAPVRKLAARMLWPEPDVEDVVQEAFLKLFRSLGSLRDPAQLRPFVFQVALSVIQSELRKRRVRRFLRLTASGDPPDRGDSRDDEAREALHEIQAALQRLDARDRAVFLLRSVEGMEVAEVAAALGVSPATVKRRLAHAQALIVRELEKDPELAAYLRRIGIAQSGAGTE